MSSLSVVTIERHIIDQERKFPEATGAFSGILYEIALAAKIISREVNMAGLVDILGGTGRQNVHGEHVKKLDIWAHEVIFKALDHSGHLCCMASEEAEEILPIPKKFPTGRYVLLYDPLDGSSNIEANVSIGTIFSLHRKISTAERGSLEDCLQPGHRQVAAGYVVYGSSTMLVYSTGAGVHGFTLDPSIGEFCLSHPSMIIPKNGKTYSVNQGNFLSFTEGLKQYLRYCRDIDNATNRPYSARYIGSMVADFHRNLINGGIFMYPGDTKNPRGKLRLMYECAPMAFLVEQAGGAATDGTRRILDIQPTDLHERTPLVIGSRDDVEFVRETLEAWEREQGAGA